MYICKKKIIIILIISYDGTVNIGSGFQVHMEFGEYSLACYVSFIELKVYFTLPLQIMVEMFIQTI